MEGYRGVSYEDQEGGAWALQGCAWEGFYVGQGEQAESLVTFASPENQRVQIFVVFICLYEE
jgi:hypothetical protein